MEGPNHSPCRYKSFLIRDIIGIDSETEEREDQVKRELLGELDELRLFLVLSRAFACDSLNVQSDLMLPH